MLTVLLTQFQNDKQLSLFNTHTHHTDRLPYILHETTQFRLPSSYHFPHITNSNKAINIGQPIARIYRQSACKH